VGGDNDDWSGLKKIGKERAAVYLKVQRQTTGRDGAFGANGERTVATALCPVGGCEVGNGQGRRVAVR